MKPDFVDDYKGPELGKTTQPLSYTALQSRLLKTSSSNDLRGQTLFAQTLSKNGRVPSPLRKFSETFKRKGFAKSGMTTMKSRNGSISSDSGEGSLSDFHTTTNELEKFSLETSGENGQETPLNKGSKKPQNLTFQKPRRFRPLDCSSLHMTKYQELINHRLLFIPNAQQTINSDTVTL